MQEIELCAHCGEAVGFEAVAICDVCLFDYCGRCASPDQHVCSEICRDSPPWAEAAESQF